MLHQTYANRPPAPSDQRPQIDPMSAGRPLVASQGAYETFFHATYPPLAIQLHAILGNREEAHHAAYQALCDAARRWNEISELANPTSWVRQRANATIRRHARLNLIRTFGRRRTPVSSPDQPRVDIAVFDALLSLPDVQRRALVFIYLGRLSLDQLALEEHVTRATVLSRLAHGTAALRHQLSYDSEQQGETEVNSERWATTEINDWVHRQLSYLAYQLRPAPGAKSVPTVSHQRWSTNATIGVVAGVLAVITLGIAVTTQLGASSYAPSPRPKPSTTTPTSQTALPPPAAVVSTPPTPSTPAPSTQNPTVPSTTATQIPVAQPPTRPRTSSGDRRPATDRPNRADPSRIHPSAQTLNADRQRRRPDPLRIEPPRPRLPKGSPSVRRPESFPCRRGSATCGYTTRTSGRVLPVHARLPPAIPLPQRLTIDTRTSTNQPTRTRSRPGPTLRPVPSLRPPPASAADIERHQRPRAGLRPARRAE